MKHGIFNIENLALDELARDGAWEFLFVFTRIAQGRDGLARPADRDPLTSPSCRRPPPPWKRSALPTCSSRPRPS